ncbi:hypothetical protein [Clostridium beijerinckii]|uniref:hypothetical protein n=1 Tax=Clostridium beijerinckii TaxID=1520 RepID=UPI000AEEAB44|nr:hypothetical protein [Clostridium beijerinckii]
MYIKRYDGPSGRGLYESEIGSGRGLYESEIGSTRGFYGPSARDFETTGTRG